MILPPGVNGWYIGWLPAAKHRGEFKFWPQVYVLWALRSGLDPYRVWWGHTPATETEMRTHCSRRQ